MPDFLSSRPNWAPTTPSLARERCFAFPFGSQEGNSRLRGRGWVDPIPTMGQTLWYCRYTIIPLRFLPHPSHLKPQRHAAINMGKETYSPPPPTICEQHNQTIPPVLLVCSLCSVFLFVSLSIWAYLASWRQKRLCRGMFCVCA